MTYHARLVTAFVTSALSLSSLAYAAGASQINISTTGDQADCSSIQMRSGDSETASAEETLNAGAGPVDVSPGGNGGLSIIGSADGAFSITACKFAFGRDRADTAGTSGPGQR